VALIGQEVIVDPQVVEPRRLGALVTGVTYRHPGVLLKTVTSLDVLSGGRAYLGIGAAWFEREHRGLGIPYPPLSERFERLEETLQIAHQMFEGDDSAYGGQHYRLERPLNSPAPVSAPRPRILVGGSGERKGLRLVAQYADACNIFEMPLDAIAHKLDVLRGHCEALGRPYDAIERTTLGSLALSRDGRGRTQTVDQAVERFAALAAIGIDHAIVGLRKAQDPPSFELVPELVARLAEIVPAGR
jgi:alkanesulfonate monooxygenase SsuD/methylene tetrahydromethanopterin reductase-like flavin-dependent oxidoreductase (luciferase family)